MITKWKLFVVLSASAVVGVTAVAFAGDLMSKTILMGSQPGVLTIALNSDNCPPNACSIVMKTVSDGASSRVIVVH